MADITVIGGINIDIEGRPFDKLRYEDSNPGRIELSYGGVGRNITENIARTGGDVAMISVIGDDNLGQGAKDQLNELGVDTHGIITMEGHNSAMYLSILNHKNDMELALCDMNILDNLTEKVLTEYLEFLRGSKVVALDGNLNKELLDFLANQLEEIKLFYDPVSAAKAVKAIDSIGHFYAIKPNIMEAEVLSGIQIKEKEDLKKAGQWFMEKGVKKVFITLNQEGVYYKDRYNEGFIKPHDVKISSATGAGDSFSAMILLGIAWDMNIYEIAAMGMAAAAVAMESPAAVNKKICKEEILRRMRNV